MGSFQTLAKCGRNIVGNLRNTEKFKPWRCTSDTSSLRWEHWTGGVWGSRCGSCHRTRRTTGGGSRCCPFRTSCNCRSNRSGRQRTEHLGTEVRASYNSVRCKHQRLTIINKDGIVIIRPIYAENLARKCMHQLEQVPHERTLVWRGSLLFDRRYLSLLSNARRGLRSSTALSAAEHQSSIVIIVQSNFGKATSGTSFAG